MFYLNAIRKASLLLIAGLCWQGGAHAADFDFFSILRAGMPNGTDWEIGLGPDGNNITGQAHFNYQAPGTMTWGNNVNQNFEIGYNANTNRAYATVFTQNGTPVTATYNGPVGGVSPDATWTISPGGLYVSAASRIVPTSVRISNLTLQAGLTVLSPLTVSTLTASQLLIPSQDSNTSPIVFQAASTGGSWYLSGQIRFQGLSSYLPFGASRSQLQMGMTVSATDTPEPSAMLLTGMGLIGLSLIRRRQKIATRN